MKDTEDSQGRKRERGRERVEKKREEGEVEIERGNSEVRRGKYEKDEEKKEEEEIEEPRKCRKVSQLREALPNKVVLTLTMAPDLASP